jgi:hypothetical protein
VYQAKKEKALTTFNMQTYFVCRIQVSVSLSSNINEAVKSRTMFPVYVLLARPVPEFSFGEVSTSPRLRL